jgi:hypothetical protein
MFGGGSCSVKCIRLPFARKFHPFSTILVRRLLSTRKPKERPLSHAAVAFIASCYSISHVGYRKHLAEVVRTQAFSIGLIGTPQIETVQAFLLLSLWGT